MSDVTASIIRDEQKCMACKPKEIEKNSDVFGGGTEFEQSLRANSVQKNSCGYHLTATVEVPTKIGSLHMSSKLEFGLKDTFDSSPENYKGAFFFKSLT